MKAIKTFQQVLWRDSLQGHWKIGFYSNYNNGHWVDNHKAKYVIPYIEEMESLVGTTQDVYMALGVEPNGNQVKLVVKLEDLPAMLDKFTMVTITSNCLDPDHE